jgi:hypothetical protein
MTRQAVLTYLGGGGAPLPSGALLAATTQRRSGARRRLLERHQARGRGSARPLKSWAGGREIGTASCAILRRGAAGL